MFLTHLRVNLVSSQTGKPLSWPTHLLWEMNGQAQRNHSCHVATLTKLFRLEVLPHLSLLTQRGRVVYIHKGERQTHRDLGSEPSFDLFLRWDHRQMTPLLRFTIPASTIGRCHPQPRTIVRIWENAFLQITGAESHEDVMITVIVSVIEHVLRTKYGSKCFM